MKIKVAVIGTDWAENKYRLENNRYGGTTYYRLIKPMLEMKSDKFEFFYHGADLPKEAETKSVIDFWHDLVSRYDIFITKAIDNEEAASNLLYMCKKLGKKLIIDLDDNFFEIKDDQPGYKYYKKGEPKRATLATYISLADGVFTSTQPLADYYKKEIKDMFGVDIKTFVLPNYNDVKDFDFPVAPKSKNRTIIGWMGSTTHYNDLKVVLPAMEKLLKEFPSLYFDIIGGMKQEDVVKFFKDTDERLLDRVHLGGGTESWDGYPELVMNLKWDIGLAPLTDDEFNRGKSHIKWMEYAMLGIPTVASKVYPYFMPILGQNTIVDGETGYLCTEKQWYAKLKKLIVDVELRKQIGANARKYIIENLQSDTHWYLWENVLSQFIETK